MILLAAVLSPTTELRANQGDIGLYLEKAGALLSGHVPYRDFGFEYPPLALVPMVVPALLWPLDSLTLETSPWLFAAWEASLVLGLGPFAALLPRREFWLAAATVALTMPIHPLLYRELVDQQALPLLILNARNALFLLLLLTMARRLALAAACWSVGRLAR